MRLWPFMLITTLATLTLLSGCAQPSAPPYRPVQVPQAPSQSSTAPSKEVPGTQSQPALPPESSTQPEREEQKPRAARAPIIAPAPPARLAEGAPSLLKRLAEANWEFASIKTTLPPLESSYADRSGENPGYLTYAYTQGDLRLYVSGGTVFALLVGPTAPDYKTFASLQPGEGYAVHRVDEFILVSRFTPVTPQELAQLQTAEWTTDQLKQGLGAPTYLFHHHGIGSYTYVWFPQQLALYGYDTAMNLPDDLYEAYQTDPGGLPEGFAKARVGELRHLDAILAKGKTSPNQKVRAAILARGGYWDNWVIVKPAGKAELRYQAGYFLLDYLFVDDQTLVYAEKSSELYAIDLTTGKRDLITQLKGQITKIGLSEGRRIWYETETKERHELSLP